MYIHTYVYIYTHIYIYIYTHTQIYIHMYMYIYHRGADRVGAVAHVPADVDRVVPTPSAVEQTRNA